MCGLTRAVMKQFKWNIEPYHEFVLLSYQLVPPSTKILTSLTADWYGVMWEIAQVKQGSASLFSGWLTACVISSWHFSGDNWIDFHGQGY